MIGVYDSFFRNYMSIVLLFLIVLSSHAITAPLHVGMWPPHHFAGTLLFVFGNASRI